MAIMIDQRPSLNGEALLWDKLREYLPEQDIVYNNREINGREFDVCVLMVNSGILVIEVKGWCSDAITVNGVDQIFVTGYTTPQRSPKKQARAYRFALLNMIKERYNVSPLVFDMVCYPFISKAEYITKRLDLVSEESFTIFREDLTSSKQLLSKIQLAYDLMKSVPHHSLDGELIGKIRRHWEQNYISEASAGYKKQVRSYSELSIFPQTIDRAAAQQIANSYFNGTKQVVFISDTKSYQLLIETFNLNFANHNIQPKSGNLSVGYIDGLGSNAKSVMTFNLEIECCPELTALCAEQIVIKEGEMAEDQKSLLKKLSELTAFNIEQYQVEHAQADHNVLVEAGAGTGKTYSMVSRVAFLCGKSDCPVSNIAEEIGMVTFTNDAAANMQVRLKQMFMNYYVLCGDPKYLRFLEETDRAHISTIHSFAIELLRNESIYTGLGTKFKITVNENLRTQIYDEKFGAFIAEKEAEDPCFANIVPVPIYDLKKKTIDLADRLLAKSVDLDLITRSDLGVTVENSLPYYNEIIEKVVIPSEHEYFSRLHSVNNVDLKESLILMGRVLKEKDGKLSNLKLRYLFIDEFQDTDDVQIGIFQMLQKSMNAHCTLFVVGDLKQSIYRFRGAKLSAFALLKSGTLYDWDSYYLNVNYRTDSRLLDLLDAVFSSMGKQHYLPYSETADRLKSRINTGLSDAQLLTVVPCHAKEEETFFDAFIGILVAQKKALADFVAKKGDEGISLNESERTIAILVRSNWQVEKLVSAAKKKGIHLDTKTGGDLFQLPSTMDLYKLVSALTNSSNPLALVSMIESNYTNLQLDYHLYHGRSEQEILEDLNRILDEFFESRLEKSWQEIKAMAYTEPALFVLKQVYAALQPWKNAGSSFDEQQHYMNNHDYLLERIIARTRADSLTLSQIAEYLRIHIITGQQRLSRDNDRDNGEIRMICTTVHKSKGLEYGIVILPYTDEEIDNPRKIKTDANYSQSRLSYTVLFENKIRETNSNYDFAEEMSEQIFEESRILYVALTRAIRSCVWMKNLDAQPKISWGTLLEG